MSEVVVKVKFPGSMTGRPAGGSALGGGEVVQAARRFRRVRGLCKRGYAIVSFVVLCPLLLFAPDSSLRIVDSHAGTRGIFARQRQS